MSFAKHSLLPQGALIEMTEIGGHIKVTALDPVSTMEASIVGDPKSSQRQLEDLAVKKLIWVIEKAVKPAKQNQAVRKGPPSGWDL